MKEKLLQKGVFLGCGLNFEGCLVQPKGFQYLKDAVQDLITKGVLQFDLPVAETKISEDEVDVITILVKAKIIQVPVMIPFPVRKSPIIITVLRPVPYVSNKVVPWHYGGEHYQQGS